MDTINMNGTAAVWLLLIAARLTTPAHAAGEPRAVAPAEAAAAKHAAVGSARKTSPYQPIKGPDSAKAYYQSLWGVDNFLVRSTASGNLIRFSYRVTDPPRAKVLGDRETTPYMYAPRSNAVLHVPVMEKVGPLRQAFTPETGKEYWMVFSNKGNPVKVGDRVNVVIGAFHVDGLVVE